MSLEGVSDEIKNQAKYFEEDIIQYEVNYITEDDEPNTFIAQINESDASPEEAINRAEEWASPGVKEIVSMPERMEDTISFEDLY